jgi:hypothetical protein
MSLNEIKKELHFAGKGHSELYEIANPMNPTWFPKDVVRDHVSENGGTWVHVQILTFGFQQRSANLRYIFEFDSWSRLTFGCMLHQR